MKQPQRPNTRDVSSFIDQVVHVSDRGKAGLSAWAAAFIEAHLRVPYGLTIEVGTRIGGSAALFGALLELMYPTNCWPPLWTVDPYGSKPYVGGDVNGVQAPIYDLDMYSTMKLNLSRCPYHAHWMLESSEFFGRLEGASYWLAGERAVECQSVESGKLVSMPIGERHRAGAKSATFILLDGEHSAASIERDLHDALQWIKPGGAIVVDNVDTDPQTLPMLKRATTNATPGEYTFSPSNQWLVVTI